MKVRSSVKTICDKCKVIKRKGVLRVSVKIPSINRDKVKYFRRVGHWLVSLVSIYPETNGLK